MTKKKSLLTNPWLALFLGIAVFAFDFASKYLTHLFLPMGTLESDPYFPYGGIGIFKNFLGIEFSIVHATNRGAAWGVMANFQHFLVLIRVLLVLVLLAYLFFGKRHPEWRIPMTLIVAGALGNIFDFFFYGHVVDMFHFVLWGYDYPVFNVADSAIFIGIFWLLIASFMDKSEKAPS